jgi:hypothetical protein
VDELLFQKIFEQIQDTLPADWNKVVLRANYYEGSYSIKYYARCSSNKYIDCFDFEGISRATLIKIFMEIDKYISPVRKEMDAKNLWNIMTLIIDDTGSFKAEFTYPDSIEYDEDFWKKKYLI